MGVSGLVRSVEVMTTTTAVTEFFDRYASALLARDEKALAGLYAVPSLILFPGQAIAVSKEKQTENFFASSWDQYEGVTDAKPAITVVLEGPGTVWADVTWTFDGEPRERMCYQLIGEPGDFRIGVLTALELE